MSDGEDSANGTSVGGDFVGGRILIHCDLDAFFAAVETLHHGLNPTEPLIIGSDPKDGRGRGIVSTCNYAARKYGIHSAMAISEAWRRCPGKPVGDGTYMQSTRGLYRRASRKVMSILRREADRFEQASVDEAYLDVTESVGGDWDSALRLSGELQQRIMKSVNLSASFGIGPTRILAKMAGEENKPNGIFRILPTDILAFFEGRPPREVPGIGPKSATMLAEWGIEGMDEAHAMGVLGLQRFTSKRFAKWMVAVLEGETSSEVSPLRSRKSVGKEHTFAKDERDPEIVLGRLDSLITEVLARLNDLDVAGRLAEVKIRYQGFETHTHGRSIPVAMDDEGVFQRLGHDLFAHHLDFSRPVRLIGFRIGQLEEPPNRQSTLGRYSEGLL
jgi:DNA polymerase IV (DinB-like DNA polymerase)